MNALLNVLKLSRDVKVESYRSVGGCGRVYIELVDLKVRSNSKIKKEVEALGYKMTLRPYCNDYSRLYMGYDNATGYEWHRAEMVAEMIRSAGFKCYVDGDGD